MDSRETSESRLTMAPFRLADWHVEPASQRISRGSETAKLEPKAMSVLVYLAQRPGEVVTREELEGAVWSDTVVGYDALSNTIIKLRKAFGDQARNPRIIETISKTGYRLIAEVSAATELGKTETIPEPEVSTAGVSQSAVQPWRRYSVGMAAALVIAVGGSLAWWQLRHAEIEPAYSLPDKPSIAILPFNNLSDDPSQEYFVDGMTEDLITDLAKIESLFVIARNTVFTYKGRAVVVPDVARELGVEFVLEGSVRRVANKVRINTQLINGASGEHVWAERYDGSLADIFALQDKVASEIIGQLKIKLTPDEQVRRVRKGTDNPEAHDAYLKGWQLYRRYTPEDFVEAIPYLTRATELDPDYGQAWAALASIYWITYRKHFAWAVIVIPHTNPFTSWTGALGAKRVARARFRNRCRRGRARASTTTRGY
jgi:TolB-like protein/DNA-binding winged helix-turn-helix (wHTH) protein